MIQYFKPRSSSQSQSGFTLIELLVIIIIVGILSAIAAPGWLAFVNNRRISTMRGQVADSLRKAQTDAKTTRTMRAVLLDKASDPPQLAVVRCNALAGNAQDCDTTGITPDWQVLGNGEVKAGVVRYTKATLDQTGKPTAGSGPEIRLVFDADGLVRSNLSDKPIDPALAGARFVVGFGITQPGSGGSAYGTPRCLVVQTLLGSLREGNDAKECGS